MKNVHLSPVKQSILLISSKNALAGLFCGRNNLHRGMFFTGHHRGTTILPTMGNLLPLVDLFKE
jgi:hypothetical protein